MKTSIQQYREVLQPLAGRAQIWRLVIGLCLALLGQVITSTAFFAALAAYRSDSGGFDANLIQIQALRDPGSILVFFATFLGPIAGIWLAVRWLHKQRFRVLLGVRQRLVPRQIAIAAAIVLVIGLAQLLLSVSGGAAIPNLPLPRWFYWIIPVVLMLFIQVSAEEIVFRGYLQGFLAARFSNRLVWLGFPAVLFGSLHWQPDIFGPNAPLVVIATGIMGLIMGHVTARTGNISAAIGLHLANNINGVLLVSSSGPLSYFSLYMQPLDPRDVEGTAIALTMNIVSLLVFYGIFLFVLWIRDRRLQRGSDVVK